MPTVPVRASCVWLAGQAACIAAVESGTLGGGATGVGATRGRLLSCEVCTVGVGRGFERGASTVTCGNTAVSGCAGLSAGDEDVFDCAEGGSCAGASGRDGGSFTGATGEDEDSFAGAVCSVGDACAFTSFALAAANAR